MNQHKNLYEYIKRWLDFRAARVSDAEAEEDSFILALNRNQSVIFHICFLFTDGTSDSVRDLYQNIMYATWKAWPTIRNKNAVDSWMRRVAVNVALSSKRHSGSHPRFVKFEEWMYDTVTEESSKVSPEYKDLMDGLDDKSRALLFLRLDGQDNKEIAETLGISEEAVNQRLYRVRKKIDKIKKEFYDDQ